jgi:hypothetical protein
MRRAVAATAFIGLSLVGTAASAATLTIPSAMTVLGTNVFVGPTFMVPGAFAPSDFFALAADGTVDLAAGGFIANAAGIIVAPPTTNTGDNPGEVTMSGPFPYASLKMGNAALGFFPVFPANAANGLGDSTPPTALVSVRTLADIFGGSFTGFVGGETLEFRIHDINTGDNSGAFRLSPHGVNTAVPEPASLALLGLGLVGVATARRRMIARR